MSNDSVKGGQGKQQGRIWGRQEVCQERMFIAGDFAAEWGEMKYPSLFVPAQARIIARHGDHAYDLVLPNGKEAVGFLSLSLSHLKDQVLPGDEVEVICSPADMDSVRITGVKDGEGVSKES